MPEDEVERSEQLQLGSVQTGVKRAKHRRGLRIHTGVKADAFVKALREGRWEQVTTEGDYERIAETPLVSCLPTLSMTFRRIGML